MCLGMPIPGKTRILIVEDEPDIAGLMQHALQRGGARVRAILRRPPQIAPTLHPGYRRGVLAIDFDAVSVRVSGTSIRLTKREFELLRFLVENRNRVLSRDRLLERVWGFDRQVETRSVDVHVGRLRGKLGQAGRQIETVIGMGYRFVENDELTD